MPVAGLSSYEGKFVPRHDTRLIPMRQLGTSLPYLDRAGTPRQDQNGAMHPEKAEQSHYGGSTQPNCEVATSGHSALTRGSTRPNSLMRRIPRLSAPPCPRYGHPMETGGLADYELPNHALRFAIQTFKDLIV